MKLRQQLGGPGGDLAGLRRALTGSAPGQSICQAAGAEQAETLAPHQSGRPLREGLERIRAAGFKAAVGMNDLRLLSALNESGAPVPQILPVVPNIAGLMRDAVEHGMVGAGLRRVFTLKPAQMVGLAWRSIGRLPRLAQRDFPSLLRSFIELELDAFRRHNPPVIFLQAQMTDLAVALGSPIILETFVEAVAARSGAAPAFATCNLAALFALLDRAGIQAAAVLAPWSEGEALMRPNANACRAAVAAHADVEVWADRLGATRPPEAALRHAVIEGGLAGIARDDISLWD